MVEEGGGEGRRPEKRLHRSSFCSATSGNDAAQRNDLVKL